MKILYCLLTALLLTTGCERSICSKNDFYRDKPGICGKIYRMEQAKNRFQERGATAAYFFLAIVLLPIILWICFRTFRAILYRSIRLVCRFIQRE